MAAVKVKPDRLMTDTRVPITGSSIILLLISTSLMVWYMHFREIDIPKQLPRAQLHSQIVEKTAPSPYRYRVLVPVVAEALSSMAEPVLGRQRALLAVYGAIEAAAVIALILVLYRFCLLFFLPLPSLVGALVANLSLVVALRDHYFQPWSLVNGVVFLLAALLLYRRKLVPFMLLAFVAVFNRETALLLPLLYLLARWGQERAPRLLSVFLLLCAVTGGGYLMVRLLQGGAPHIYPLSEIFRKNLTPKYLGFMALNLTLFMGFMWMFAVRGFGALPPFIKRLALFVPLYVVLVLLFGVWKEVRLLLPLYPVLIPAVLTALFPGGRRNNSTA